MQYFLNNGFNSFRITFLMERMVPPATGLTGAFNQTYLSGLTTAVNYVTSKGGYAIIDPHNFGRYNNGIITDYASFGTFWKNLAAKFATNTKVIFGEPYMAAY